ncbi:hypothetical protein PI124_g16737 [Phytophthora idaei]|nr:hypothetical protein PI125_g12299 [Phytophthora idaei]KAG3238305.1 hypothetical protein PI124_g16737 [Phytophthora idaei]
MNVSASVHVAGLNPLIQQQEQPLLSTDVNKLPPKMEGSFNLYRAQIKAYLHRFNAWGIVDGSITRPIVQGAAQQQYDKLDYFVKDSLLRGAKVEGAERMCDLSSGKEMWEDLEAHYTKREFSNYVCVMKKFFMPPIPVSRVWTPGCRRFMTPVVQWLIWAV